MSEFVSVLAKIQQQSDQLLAALATSGRWRDYHGPELDRLGQLLSDRMDQRHVRLCSSGTVAVELALRGLKIGAGQRVLLAGYDFPGNFRAIEAVGAHPVLVDLEPNEWVAAVPQGKSELVDAVIVSPLYGALPDLPQWRRWCNDVGAKLILDACQCPGATLEDSEIRAPRSLCHWADASCLSFGGSKILTAGRGGAVLSDDPGLMARINQYAERGNDSYPLSLMQATALLPQVEFLDEANRYRSQQVKLLANLAQDFEFLTDPTCESTRIGTRVHYKKAWQVISSEFRDRLLVAAREQNLPLGEGFRGFVRRSSRRCTAWGDLEYSRQAAERTIVLDHRFLTATSADDGKNKLLMFFSCFSSPELS